MTSTFELYDAARLRIGEVVRDADPAAPVAACPAWTVQDVVAHLAGVVADIAAGRLEGAATDAWTARQVDERRDRSIAECLAEWEGLVGAAKPLFESSAGSILVADVVSHEHDLRAATHRAGERDNEGVAFAADTMLRSLDRRIRTAGLPALRVVSERGDRVVGEGEPSGTLRAPSFELLRAVSGRRSRAQVLALEWDGDARTWIDAFFLFGPAEQDVSE